MAECPTSRLLCEKWDRLLCEKWDRLLFKTPTAEILMGAPYGYGCGLDRTRAEDGPSRPRWRGY